MTTEVNQKAKAEARAKLDRLQKSPKFKSFFNADAIDAFSDIEGSAFAGKSLKKHENSSDPSRWERSPAR